MANPNLVRKPAIDANSVGEISPSQVLTQGNNEHNYVINGGFDVWQRATVGTAGGESFYGADRWISGNTGGTAAFTASRSTDVPSNGLSNYSYDHTTSTAATLTGSQRCGVFTRLEGQQISSFYQSSITISFWVKSNLTGTFGGWIGDGTATAVYVWSYTINQANTWEQKSITIDMTQKIGSQWTIDTSPGMYLYFTMGAGPSTTGATLNTWVASTTLLAPAGQVNINNTVGNYFRITQVQINRGANIAPFRRNGITYQGEYAACQRYYELCQNTYYGDASIGTTYVANSFFSVIKRVAPTISVVVSASIGNGGFNPRSGFQSSPWHGSLSGNCNAAGPARGWNDIIAANAEF